MAFQRLKYRVEPLVPELEDKIADGGLSLMKKVKKEESKDLNDNSPGKVLFYPGYTQNTRTEIIVYSDEVALRKETKPNFVERVAAQEEYMKREAEDAIMSRQRTLMKQRLKDASDAAQSSEAFSKIGMKAAAGGAIGLPVDENDDDDEQNEKYMDEKMKQDRAEIDRVRGIKFARYRMSDVHHGRGESEI
jgi:alpha-galactosidase/6-phospho-beta-glucosidase family protein